MAVLLYYFYSKDPSDTENLYVKCSFKALTGLDCPGCGGQRCVHHLLHFDIVQAFRYNAFLVVVLPYIGLMLYYEFKRYFWKIPRPNNFITSSKMEVIFLVLLVIFGLLRNLPFHPFTLLATPE